METTSSTRRRRDTSLQGSFALAPLWSSAPLRRPLAVASPSRTETWWRQLATASQNSVANLLVGNGGNDTLAGAAGAPRSPAALAAPASSCRWQRALPTPTGHGLPRDRRLMSSTAPHRARASGPGRRHARFGRQPSDSGHDGDIVCLQHLHRHSVLRPDGSVRDRRARRILPGPATLAQRTSRSSFALSRPPNGASTLVINNRARAIPFRYVPFTSLILSIRGRAMAVIFARQP